MVMAGRLNRRVELQEEQSTRGTAGGIVEAFVTRATVWAEVMPMTGKEFNESDIVTSEVSLIIGIRYGTDVTALWRVKVGTRTFAILAVLNPRDGRRRLKLVCKELPSGEPV